MKSEKTRIGRSLNRAPKEETNEEKEKSKKQMNSQEPEEIRKTPLSKPIYI